MRSVAGRHMKPANFDLGVHDLGQARAFFDNVPGWHFEKVPMPYEVYRIHAGPEAEPGIDAGIGAPRDASIAGGNPLTQVSVPGDALQAAGAAHRQNGD